jgi:hypothetical protein
MTVIPRLCLSVYQLRDVVYAGTWVQWIGRCWFIRWRPVGGGRGVEDLMTERYDLFYDRAGEPISMEEWSRLFRDMTYKVVEKTHVGDAEVSTVWIGADHGFGEGPPIIFETLIFGGALDQVGARYSTEEEARAGHEKFVKLATAAHSAAMFDA